MTHPVDVPSSALLPQLAATLKERGAVRPPPWAAYARTGVHTERAPVQTDWWFTRSASVLRKLSIGGPSGVMRLSEEYGGRRDRGSAPYHARAGSRSIIREIMQQLEQSGLVQGRKNRGRALTAAGQQLVDKVAKDVLKGLSEKRPELAKYL